MARKLKITRTGRVVPEASPPRHSTPVGVGPVERALMERGYGVTVTSGVPPGASLTFDYDEIERRVPIAYAPHGRVYAPRGNDEEE